MNDAFYDNSSLNVSGYFSSLHSIAITFSSAPLRRIISRSLLASLAILSKNFRSSIALPTLI